MKNIDFSPLLAQNIIRNQMTNDASFGFGQLLGENSGKIKKGLGEGYGKLKGFGGGLLGKAGEFKEGLSNKKKSLLDYINKLPSNINQKMIDDKGLFQGGMHSRPFGRARDEADIGMSNMKGLMRGLPYKPQNQGITKYKNGQIVNPNNPEARPGINAGSQDVFNNLRNMNYSPSRLDIPGLSNLPQWMQSPAQQLGISEDASETEKQDALMQWNLEGRTTGQEEAGNIFGFNFNSPADTYQGPQDQTNWWGN